MTTIVAKAITTISLLFLFIVFAFHQHIAKGYLSKRDIKHNLFVIFIISLILPLNIPLFSLPMQGIPAYFGDTISISINQLILLSFLLFPSINNSRLNQSKAIKYMFFFVFIIIATYFLPSNLNKSATLIGIYYFGFLFLSAIVIYKKFSSQELISGLWKSFKIIIIIQLVLSIAFPVLNIIEALTIWGGEFAISQATRGGERPSAIGTFGHPGPLGLITSFIFIFFISNYFQNIRKKEALIYSLLSVIVIILTQSRTSYFISLVALIGIFIFHKFEDYKHLFIRIILSLFVTIVIINYFIFYTDFGRELFLSKNFQQMQTARMVHYVLGWDIFVENPIIGVGINSHLSYMSREILFIGLGLPNDGADDRSNFFVNNSLHNSHLIILVETGLIGGFLWFFGFYKIIFNNIKYIIKQKKILINYIEKKQLVSVLLFSTFLVISYFLYAFTGWATMHYYSFSFLILAIILSQKTYLENEVSLKNIK